MKLLFITVFILFLIQLNNAQSDEERKTGKLIIIVTGLQSDEGEVRLALCNSRREFEINGEYYLKLKLNILEGKSEHVISELPFGEYAIKLYHDENSDGVINANFLGIPTEDYAYSNNVSGTFGPPDYEDAKFLFEQPEMTINISVN